MKIAYFDTNVFDQIYKQVTVSEADQIALRSAVDEGKICILLSILNLEEVISALKSRHDLAIAEINLILNLARWDRLLKGTDELVRDDIRCFARNEALSQPFVVDSEIISGLQALRNLNNQDISELLVMAEEVQKQKEEFMAGMTRGREELSSDVKKLHGWHPTFEEYWVSLAE